MDRLIRYFPSSRQKVEKHKKIIVLSLSLLCLAAFGIYVMTHPRVMSLIAKSVINAGTTDLEFKELNFRAVHIGPKNLAAVEGIQFTAVLNDGKSKWWGEVPSLYLDSLKSFWDPQKKMTVSFLKANFQGSEAQLKDVSFKAGILFPNQKQKWQIADGTIHAISLTSKGIIMTELEAQLSGNRHILTVEPWYAQWAGGNISGRLSLREGTYTIHLNLQQVDLSEIARIRQTIFGRMRGRLEGVIDIQGTSKDINTFKGYFNAPAGAEMRAAILKFIFPYIPASMQKDFLEQLIMQDENVFFDHADIHLEDIQDNFLKLQIKLASKKLNLDIEVTVDVNVEGGLRNLLARFYEFSS